MNAESELKLAYGEFGTNLLLALLNPVPATLEAQSEPQLSTTAPAPVDQLDQKQIAELTIAELMVRIGSQEELVQSLREELVATYTKLINSYRLLDDLEASYGREQCPEPSYDTTNPQGEQENGEE